MYVTHHFANLETLSRARAWLSRLGFGPGNMEAHTDGIPRLSVAVEPSRLSGVEMVLSAVERSDPRGWPAFWDVAHQAHLYPVRKRSDRARAIGRQGTTVIGWHPTD